MLIVVFLAVISAFEAAYITELTDDNFYEYVKDKNVVMVDFYAPWYGFSCHFYFMSLSCHFLLIDINVLFSENAYLNIYHGKVLF